MSAARELPYEEKATELMNPDQALGGEAAKAPERIDLPEPVAVERRGKERRRAAKSLRVEVGSALADLERRAGSGGLTPQEVAERNRIDLDAADAEKRIARVLDGAMRAYAALWESYQRAGGVEGGEGGGRLEERLDTSAQEIEALRALQNDIDGVRKEIERLRELDDRGVARDAGVDLYMKERRRTGGAAGKEIKALQSERRQLNREQCELFGDHISKYLDEQMALVNRRIAEERKNNEGWSLSRIPRAAHEFNKWLGEKNIAKLVGKEFDTTTWSGWMADTAAKTVSMRTVMNMGLIGAAVMTPQLAVVPLGLQRGIRAASSYYGSLDAMRQLYKGREIQKVVSRLGDTKNPMSIDELFDAMAIVEADAYMNGKHLSDIDDDGNVQMLHPLYARLREEVSARYEEAVASEKKAKKLDALARVQLSAGIDAVNRRLDHHVSERKSTTNGLRALSGIFAVAVDQGALTRAAYAAGSAAYTVGEATGVNRVLGAGARSALEFASSTVVDSAYAADAMTPEEVVALSNAKAAELYSQAVEMSKDRSIFTIEGTRFSVGQSTPGARDRVLKALIDGKMTPLTESNIRDAYPTLFDEAGLLIGAEVAEGVVDTFADARTWSENGIDFALSAAGGEALSEMGLNMSEDMISQGPTVIAEFTADATALQEQGFAPDFATRHVSVDALPSGGIQIVETLENGREILYSGRTVAELRDGMRDSWELMRVYHSSDSAVVGEVIESMPPSDLQALVFSDALQHGRRDDALHALFDDIVGSADAGGNRRMTIGNVIFHERDGLLSYQYIQEGGERTSEVRLDSARSWNELQDSPLSSSYFTAEQIGLINRDYFTGEGSVEKFAEAILEEFRSGALPTDAELQIQGGVSIEYRAGAGELVATLRGDEILLGSLSNDNLESGWKRVQQAVLYGTMLDKYTVANYADVMSAQRGEDSFQMQAALAERIHNIVTAKDPELKQRLVGELTAKYGPVLHPDLIASIGEASIVELYGPPTALDANVDKMTTGLHVTELRRELRQARLSPGGIVENTDAELARGIDNLVDRIFPGGNTAEDIRARNVAARERIAEARLSRKAAMGEIRNGLDEQLAAANPEVLEQAYKAAAQRQWNAEGILDTSATDADGGPQIRARFEPLKLEEGLGYRIDIDREALGVTPQEAMSAVLADNYEEIIRKYVPRGGSPEDLQNAIRAAQLNAEQLYYLLRLEQYAESHDVQEALPQLRRDITRAQRALEQTGRILHDDPQLGEAPPIANPALQLIQIGVRPR